MGRGTQYYTGLEKFQIYEMFAKSYYDQAWAHGRVSIACVYVYLLFVCVRVCVCVFTYRVRQIFLLPTSNVLYPIPAKKFIRVFFVVKKETIKNKYSQYFLSK